TSRAVLIGTAYVMRLPLIGASTMPATLPAPSTSAPPDDAVLDAAAVSSSPLVVGPLSHEPRLSVDARSPSLSHGCVSPGPGAPTTHTVSPVFGMPIAN